MSEYLIRYSQQPGVWMHNSGRNQYKNNKLLLAIQETPQPFIYRELLYRELELYRDVCIFATLGNMSIQKRRS